MTKVRELDGGSFRRMSHPRVPSPSAWSYVSSPRDQDIPQSLVAFHMRGHARSVRNLLLEPLTQRSFVLVALFSEDTALGMSYALCMKYSILLNLDPEDHGQNRVAIAAW